MTAAPSDHKITAKDQGRTLDGDVDLTGTRVLVTGANRGIGLAMARELAKRPLRLLLGVRDVDRPLAGEIGPGAALEIRIVRCDLSSKESIEACLRGLGEEAQLLDVLVNNAGRLTAGLLEEQDVAQIYAMFQVNLLGAVHLTQRVLPGMLRRGRGLIVNNASISALAHLPTATTYSAAKAGLLAFTEALHRELRGTGVRTLALITGAVATDMLDELETAEAGRVDMSSWRRTTPESWAVEAVRAMERNQRLAHPPGVMRVLELLSHGPPSAVDAVAQRMFKRPAS